MTTLSAPSRPRPGTAAVVLDPVAHGLVDPAGSSGELDEMLALAGHAERAGARAVVVPAPPVTEPVTRHRATLAQALAVLLATRTVPVTLVLAADTWDAGVVARFAANASRLAGERLTLDVEGPGAPAFAASVRRLWSGPVAARPLAVDAVA